MAYSNGEGLKDFQLGFRGRAEGGNDEGDCEVMVENESFGKLNEWDEVTHPWTRYDGYVGCLFPATSAPALL